MITGDCAAMETWSLLKKKKKKKKKAKVENMNYKGYKELIPESHWIKKDGTDLFICSECGHLQDIFKNGTACEECGTWMVARLIKTEEEKDGKTDHDD